MDTGLEKFKRKVDVEIAQNMASEESQVSFVWLAVLQTQKRNQFSFAQTASRNIMRTLAWSTKNFRFTREQNKHIRIADRIYSFYFKILLIRWISPTTYLKKQHSIRFQRMLSTDSFCRSGIFLSFKIKLICRVSL